MKWLHVKLACVTFGAALLGGCSGAQDDGKTVYSGTVSWNGAPLPSGAITFSDVQGALDAAQVSEGRFTVRLKPGLKTISVTAEKRVGERKEDRIPDPVPIMHQFLPAEFNSATKLSREIRGPDEPIAIELTGTEVPAPAPATPPPGRE